MIAWKLYHTKPDVCVWPAGIKSVEQESREAGDPGQWPYATKDNHEPSLIAEYVGLDWMDDSYIPENRR